VYIYSGGNDVQTDLGVKDANISSTNLPWSPLYSYKLYQIQRIGTIHYENLGMIEFNFWHQPPW